MTLRSLGLVVSLLLVVPGRAPGETGQSLEELGSRVEALREAGVEGEVGKELGRALTDLGWAEIGLGDASLAGQHFFEALEQLEASEPDLALAMALAGLAMVRQYEGEALAAENLYRRSAKAFEDSGNGLLADHAAVQKNLADLLAARGRLAEAEPLYREVVTLWSSLFGSDHELVEAARIQRAGILQSLAREDEARSIYDEILESRRNRLGPTHAGTLEMIAAVVSVDVSEGRYAQAEERCRAALDAIDVLDAEDASTGRQRASLLDNLARIEAAAGAYGRAVELGEQALVLVEAIAPEETLRVEGIRVNLATAHRDRGDYEKAEPLYRLSLENLKSAGLRGGYFEGTVLHELGRLYADIGDRGRARELFESTLSIYEASLDSEHFFIATTLSSLAALALDERRLERAEELFRRAAEIYESCFGARNVYTARAFGNLAAALQAKEEYPEAAELLDRSIFLLTELLGSDHPDTAYYINNRGVLALSEKRFDEADRILREALAQLEETLGGMHPATSRIRHNLAYVNGILGRSALSAEMFRETLAAEEAILQNVFAITSERQKLAFVEQSSSTFDRFLSLVASQLSEDPAILRVALDSVLARKAIVFDAQSRERQSLATALDPEGRKHWQQLGELRGALARLLLSPPSGQPVEEVMERVEELGREIQQLEAALAASSALASSELRKHRIASAELAEHLPEASVLIEIVRFREVDWDEGHWADTHRYAAFVLRPSGEIAWVDLGSAEALEKKASSYMRGLRADPHSRRGQRLQEASADGLYRLLWSPLEATTAGSSRIWISPDGLLNAIPFAALRDASGRYLVERYALGYLTSGRDLATVATREPDLDLFLIANPAFGSPGKAGSMSVDSTPGSRAPWLAFGKALSFAPLPGTEAEARGVPDLVPGNRDSVLEGEAASEEALLASGHARVMHLATHGFFLASNEEDEIDATEGPRIRVGDNPLVRSGLALAGANQAASAGSNLDGILTALEVSSLDLRGTDLVTLSACDTGRGEIRNGEGVFGMRRAFALAGARHLLMSLWPVADEITADQMLAFYRHYGAGVDPVMALRRAQLDSIERIKEDLGSAPPSLWAAFVLQGHGG